MLGGPVAFYLIVILSVWCQCIHGDTRNQPKLEERSGALILQAAQDKNITVRLQRGSTFTVNEVDVLKTLQKRKRTKPQSFDIDVANLPFRVQRIERTHRRLVFRVRNMENRNDSVPGTRLVDLLGRVGRLTQNYNQMAQDLMDKCVSNPCKNGGECYSTFGDFHCICPESWTGKTCDTDVDECETLSGSDLGCQNNATCVNSDGNYRCVCSTGFSGTHCRERKSDCEKSAPGELCGKGTCIPASNELGYKCICNSGWKTDNFSQPCTVDVNECVEAHVMCHTSCINLPGTFRCGPCPSGYTGNGIKCDDIDECAVDNGGCSIVPKVRCINTEGSHHCGKCPPGWTGNGRLCMQVESDSCGSDNICHPQAICQYVSNVQVCQCPAGMTGSGYGPGGCTRLSVDPCADHHCKNGGICVSRGMRHSCICPPGFRRPFCDRRSACAQRPCLNGGMCVDDDSPNGFHCVCSRGSSGPLCQEKQLSCGSVLRDRSGELTYPANGLYEPSKTCAWGIRTDHNLTLNVTFSRFDLEEHPECGKDFLQINDGRSLATPLIGRFCGNKLPNGGNIISSHNTLLLWFRSDNTTNLSGFSLKWTSIAPICGGHQELKDDSQGIIRSPGYPGKSPRNRDCEWSLEAPFGRRLLLRFYEVAMNTKANCTRDTLIIYDSTDILEKICIAGTPAPIYTSSNVAKIHFHTGAFSEESLFQVHYEVVPANPGCGGIHSEAKGTFQLTSEMKNCNFLIHQPPGTRVAAKFTRSPRPLGVPTVKVYDGKTDDDPVLTELTPGAVLNGTSASPDAMDLTDVSAPAQLLSSQNFMLISMAMNRSPLDLDGTLIYDVSFERVCGEKYNDPDGGTFSTPNYPKPYFNDLNCTYFITGPLNTIVHVNITDYDISEYRDSCNDDSDFVEIFYDINEPGKRHCKDVPLHIVSPKNHLRIDFHSTSNPQRRRGFLVAYSFEKIGCGGVLRGPEGSFSATESTTQCEWILEAPGSQVIELNLDYARMGTNCAPGESDVQIFRNDTDTEGHLIQSLCGGEKQVRTVISSNLATVFLRPLPAGLNTGVSYGIKANYKFIKRSPRCGTNFTDLSGSIQSPGFPDTYFNSVDCTWVIHAPLDSKIELVPRLFALEAPSSADCYSDYLEIRNGMSEVSPLIGKYCGTTILPHIPSFTNHLYLHFHSDDSVSAAGFDILFRQTSTGCGGLLSSYSGSIASPHYPEVPDGPVQCDWKITVSTGSTIDLQIQRLSPTADLCSNNVLTIYDGADALSDQIQINCSQTDPNIRLTSRGNAVYVRYVISENTTADGQQFYLNYTTNCRQTLTALAGVIESPNFVGEYPNNLRCEWTIVGSQSDKIILTFSHFELEKDDFTCIHDEFEVIDMKGEEILETKKICNAMETTDSVTSDGNKLVVKFTSDYSNSGSGFRLEFKRNGCGGHLTRPRGTIVTPNAPYSTGMECEWLIETTPGMLIVLDIGGMQIETDTNNCSVNGLTVKNNKDDEHFLLKECKIPSMGMSVTSQGTTMSILFRSDSRRSRKFMRAFYWTKAAECGGIFRSSSGTIMSPNYPRNYTQNTVCEWMISTENAFLLSLGFMTMDIPADPNCTKGFVEVYNGRKGEQNSKLIRRFCQSGSQIYLRSNGNLVHIILNTNGGPPAKGFLMKYEKRCGFTITKSSGLLKSNMDEPICIWNYTPTSPEIKLAMTVLKLECHCDGLEAEECRKTRGLRIFSIRQKVFLEHSYCEKAPTDLTLTGPYFFSVYNAISFVAKYSLGSYSCGGHLTSLRGFIASPYYPSMYPMNTECVWTIEAPPGNNIEVTIDDMNLDATEGCNRDYVELRENARNGKLLGAFCSNESISTSSVAFEKMWIKFHSGNQSYGVNTGGFKLTWTYAQLNELSGARGRIEPPSSEMLRYEPEPFKWRIIAPRNNIIWLSFREYNAGLQLYDGFDENALVVDIQTSPWEFTSSGNVVMMMTDNPTAEHFRLDWRTQAKSEVTKNTTSSKCNETFTIDNTGAIDLASPGYPNGYEHGLICEWIVKSDRPTRHAIVNLYDVRLEAMSGCASDYLQILTSTNLIDWHDEFRICDGPPKTMVPFKTIHGTPYLKLKFVTDFSINGTGFSSTLDTACGGNLTDPVGRIQGIADELSGGNCTWQIRVRPGRRIKFTFEFPATKSFRNSSHLCANYAIIREGITADGPILPPGRICSSTNFNRTVISNTNHATILFHMQPNYLNLFFLHEIKMWNVTYREYSVCGGEVRLTPYSRSVNITSPNYPHVPHSHTECVWLVVAPPGESVRAEFVDQFSMNARYCDQEFVELRDGSTELARQLGKYCRRPSTIRSSGNVLYLRYVTNIGEPRNGFKVNVSMSTCGGTFTQFDSLLTSPNYPAPGGYPSNSVCEFVVKVNSFNGLNLTFLDVHLPFDKDNLNASDRIVIYQMSDSPTASLGDELAVIYGNATSMPILLVDNNVAVIRFYSFKANSVYRGFKLQYKRMLGFCFRDVSGESGTLSLYLPMNRRHFEYCRWHITVPKGRRIKAHIVTMDAVAPESSDFEIKFFNDYQGTSLIAARNLRNLTALPSVSSTDNHMFIIIAGLRRFAMQSLRITYSSDEPSSCPGDFTTDSGSLSLRNMDHSANFYCQSDVILSGDVTLSLNFTSIEVRLFNVTSISPCLRYANNYGFMSLHTPLCVNITNKNVFFPFKRGRFVMFQNEAVKLQKLEATFVKHRCGGEYYTRSEKNFSLPILEDTYGPLQCAWMLVMGYNKGYALTGTFDFKHPCQDEHLVVYTKGIALQKTEIGRFCNNGTFNLSNLTSQTTYVEYRTPAYSRQSSVEFRVQNSTICGERLTVDGLMQLVNPYYKNNLECVWDLRAREGFFLRLLFAGRFFVEGSKGCVKDYVEVRKFDQGEWVSLGRFCGRELPPTINTTSDRMQVIFRTDGDITADGFELNVMSTCIGEFNVTDAPQKIVYPSMWSLSMPRLSCNYTLLSDSDKFIKVKFNKLAIGFRRLCGMSQMSIRKKNSQQEFEEMGPYCNSNEISEVKAKKYMSVAYTGVVQTSGYEFEFSLETCGGDVTTPQWIESQKNDQGTGYANHMNCVWNVTAPPNHDIVVQFKYLVMEMNSQCSMDYVEIYKGSLMRPDTLEDKFCGNLTVNPPVVYVEGNRAVIAAISDYWVTNEGFKARIIFSKSCKERLTLTQANTPTVIDRDQVVASNEVMFCDHRLMAPQGFRIKIDVETIDLNPKNVTCRDDCGNCDYLEIVDSVASGSLRMTKLCKPSATASLVSSFKDAIVRAHLEKPGRHKYKLSLRLLEVDCGAQSEFQVKADSPIRISSAVGRDKLYFPNTHCIWKISSDMDFDIKLENLNLQNVSDVTGECLDYLQIKFKYPQYITAKKLCGVTSSYTIKVSQIETAEVIFHTDESIQSTGFTLIASATPSCNGTYTSTNGRITGHFEKSCANTFELPENYTVNIVMRQIYFPSTNCSVNYVKAVDLTTNNEIYKECNNDDTGLQIFSSTNRLRLEVMSTYSVNLHAYYYGSLRTLPPGCGGSLDMQEGYVKSPAYEKFPNATVCRWNITTVAPMRISLVFQDIHMGTKCRTNYLDIIEIDSSGQEKVAQRYCSRDVRTTFTSTSNRVAFATVTTPDFDGTGWALDYHTQDPNTADSQSISPY